MLDAVRALVVACMCSLGVSVLRALLRLANGSCGVESLSELISVFMVWPEI